MQKLSLKFSTNFVKAVDNKYFPDCFYNRAVGIQPPGKCDYIRTGLDQLNISESSFDKFYLTEVPYFLTEIFSRNDEILISNFLNDITFGETATTVCYNFLQK